jgi:CO/xanthine dehydrogenase FAD-binding subunit
MARYLRPIRLEDALAALARDAADPPCDPMDRLSVLAGATDVYPTATTRQAWFQPTPGTILDISAIAELRGISADSDGIHFGALATWSDVIAADLPRSFDALKQASRQVGGVQIQNRGTIAGNICNASPAADGAPPLLALDAEVSLRSATGSRRMPLTDFILGNRRTALQPGEMVTALHVPTPAADERSVFLKLGARSYLVISIASVAINVHLDARGCILRARMAVGACSAVPQRLHALETQLIGFDPAHAADAVTSDHLAMISPIDDIRATARYRREAALTLVRRALASFADRKDKAA